jgi:diguanylate cyclase (GGDEF)-like protein
VISPKKIPQDDGAAEETLLRIVRLLLQGMEQHAIEGDPGDLHGFRTGIRRLTDSLEGDVTVSELLVQAGSVLPTLQDYNRRTTRYLKRPAGEWQAAVIMLISALAAMQPAEGPRVSQLREIAGRVRGASGPEEAHKIRLQLSECLTSLQLDNRRNRDPDPPVPLPSPAGPQPQEAASEPVAGLPTRSQAEEALAGAWQTDPPSYVAVMTIDRLRIFNMRFGHSVGDEVMRYYGEFLRERLRPEDRMFRWSDAALLVLLPRPNRLEIVRDEIARVTDARCEHTVQTASRTILLPIAARWTVFPSMAAPRLLIHKIDAFTESAGKNSPQVSA